MQQWHRTHEYAFTKPLNNKRVTHILRLAVLITHTELKSRKDALRKLGIPEERVLKPGQLTCVFNSMIANNVITYDKIKKCYKKGKRHKEYMQYVVSQIQKLKTPSKEVQDFLDREYKTILKECSNSLHFILS